jgi:hypothetical protein
MDDMFIMLDAERSKTPAIPQPAILANELLFSFFPFRVKIN